MHRRRFLAASGALLGTALGGCMGGSDSSGSTDTPTGTPTNTPTGTPTTTPSDSGVVVEDVVARKAVTYESIMGSGGVLAGENRQYVVASVRIPPDLSEPGFTFEADGESWTPGLPDTHGATDAAAAGHEGGPFDASLDAKRSFLAFTVPSPLSASDPRISLVGYPETAWSLPDAAVDRLAEPAPRFELADLTVPDQVSQGDPMSASLTVRNVSDVDGRFLAAVYWPTERIADDDESQVIESQVAAGEEKTATLSVNTEYTAVESGPVKLRVEGHVRNRRSVRVTDVGSSE